MPQVTEQQALEALSLVDVLENPEDKAAARRIALGYEEQQTKLGAPLFPEYHRKEREDNDRIRSRYTDKERHGFDDDLYRDFAETFPTPEERSQYINSQFLAKKFGKSTAEVRAAQPDYRDQYARQTWGAPVATEKEFADRLAADFDFEDDLSKRGQQAALQGAAGWEADSLLDADAENPIFKGREKQWRDQFKANYSALQAEIAPMEATINSFVEGLQVQMGARDGEAKSDDVFMSALMDIPKEKRGLFLDAVAARGGEGTFKNLAQKMGEATGRQATNMIRDIESASIIKGLDGMARQVVAGTISSADLPTEFGIDPLDYLAGPEKANRATKFETSGVTVPRAGTPEYDALSEDQKAALSRLENERDFIELYKRVNDIATGVVDPAEGDGWIEKGLIGVSAMVPNIALMAAGPAGAAVNIRSYQGQATMDYLRNNPGADTTTAARIGEATGIAQGLLDYIPTKIVAGKVPGLSKWLEKATLTKGGLVGRAGVRLGAGAAFETGQEFAQDVLVPGSVEEIAGVLKADLPEVNWDARLSAFTSAESLSELVPSIVMLSLIGAGVGGVKDYANGWELVGDRRLLIGAGLTEADADAITEAASKEDAAGAQALLRDAFAKIDQKQGVSDVLPEARQAALANVIEEADKRIAAIEKGESSGIIPAVGRSKEGWTLRFQDGSTRTYGSHAEADGARWKYAEEKALTELDEFRGAVQTVERQIEAGREVVFSFSPEKRTLRDAVVEGEVTEKAAMNRAGIAEEIGGQKYQADPEADIDPEQEYSDNYTAAELQALAEDDKLALFEILGSNKTEFADGVQRTTVKLFRGATPLTVIEEKLEGDAALMLANNKRDWLLTRLRRYERASGDRMLPRLDSEVTDGHLKEAFSHLGQSYLVGRSRKSERQDLGFLGASGRKKAAKVFRSGLGSTMEGYRNFFRSVWKRAAKLNKLRREGKLDEELEQELARSVGYGEQAQYESDALKEAEGFKTALEDMGFEAEPEGVTIAEATDDAPFSVVIADDDYSKVVSRDGMSFEGPASFSVIAYHGTPHKVEKFSTDKIGTGEGAQVYGWGLYFAGTQAVAKHYAATVGGKPSKELVSEMVGSGLSDFTVLAKKLKRENKDSNLISEAERLASRKYGNVYSVRLKPDDDKFIDWDKPFSEQSESVKSIVRGLGISTDGDGQEIYKGLSSSSPALAAQGYSRPEYASYLFSKAGIAGIRYFDGNSRNRPFTEIKREFLDALPEDADFADVMASVENGDFNPDQAAFLNALKSDGWLGFDFPAQAISAALSDKIRNWDPSQNLIDSIKPLRGDATYNYVIFDDADVEIVEENGQPVAEPSFSVITNADARIAEMFTPLYRNPEQRRKIVQRIQENVAIEAQKFAAIARANRPNTDIERERKEIEGALFNEKLDTLSSGEIAALSNGNLLEDNSLQPILSELLNEKTRTTKSGKKVRYWTGSLMSKSEAKRRGYSMGGEWDAVPEGLPPYVWGGSIAPDQAATMFGFDSPEAFFDALSAEIQSRSDRKREIEEANRRVRELEKEARTESRAWAEEQRKLRQTVGTDRATLVAAMRTLDAMISALPVEIRGKIGGFVRLAQFKTPGAMLDELGRRVNRLDTELERWLKKEADKGVKKLFETAKPAKDQAGKARKGKAGADIHDLFDTARQAWKNWTTEKAEGHALGIEAEIAKGEMKPEREAHALLEAELVRLFGGWNEADSIRKLHALETAEEIWREGYHAFKLKKAAEKERRDGIRSDLRADTGKAGKKSERALAELAGVTLPGRAKDFFLSLLNFEQLTAWAFGKESKWAQWFADEQRKAENAKLDAVQSVVEGIEDLFAEMAGGKFKGEQLQFRMMQRSLTATAANGDVVPLSELEALSALLMWQQEDGKRHLRGKRDEDGNLVSEWSYDEGFIDEISGKLSPEAWKVLGYLQAEYGKEYEPLNAVYRDVYGINLPKNPNYSPLLVKPQQASAGQTQDPLTGSTVSAGSFTPGSLRTRAQISAEPDFRDAVATFIGHKKQIEHWKANARFILDANAVLGNRELGNSIEAAHGQEAVKILRKWLDAIAQGGVRDAAAGIAAMKTFEKMTGRAASMALVGRIGTLAIQSTQLGAAAALMPTGAYVVRLGKLLSGNLGWGKALASPYIQRRLAQQPVMVQAAMEGLKAGKPSQLKHQVRRIGSLLNGADALFTAGTFAMVHDYHFREAVRGGMTQAEAETYANETAERVLESVAQPTRMGTRSFFEVSSSNPGWRLAWAFASDARKNAALLGFNWAKGSATDKARATLFVIGISGILSSVIRSAWRDLRDDEDEEVFDEKYWSPKRLALSTSTDWLYGIPLFGEEVQRGFYAAAGEYKPSGGLFSAISEAPGAAKNLIEGDSTDNLRDVEKILTAMGLFSDGTAAATSVMHIVRDIYGLGESFVSE